MNWDDHLQYVALSDIGMRRANNQDAHAEVLASDMESWQRRGHFFMVADGMGAHAAGELASRLAVDGVLHLYHKYQELSPPEALQRAVLETNSEVHRRGQANSDFHNMGTTASTLVIVPQGALIGHIGDSRVYRMRGDRLQQLTRDHSLVWELREQLADNGDLAIPKNVITRSLGPNPTVQVDIEGPLPVQKDDTFLVCSDGLTGRVTDEELASFLKHMAPSEAGPLLVDLANLRGGPDNTTLIIARVVGDLLATADSEPLRIGKKAPPAVLQPAIWVCSAVCLLGAIILGITNNTIPAIVALAGVFVSLLVGAFSLHRVKSLGISLTSERRLGRGPYTDTKCRSLRDAVKLLRDITGDLRRVIGSDNWSVDWTQYDAHCKAAEQAEDPTQALRSHASAMRALMQQIHEEHSRRASDSGIEL